MTAQKVSDREVVLTRTFAASREVLFAALTQPEHLLKWMKAGTMTLAACDVDLRAGGSFRYRFERAGGRAIEVRGAYRVVEPPRRFEYEETYDFSPLVMQVATVLEEKAGKTIFTQRLLYVSKEERDEDFPGVASSSKEAYGRLEAYLAERGR